MSLVGMPIMFADLLYNVSGGNADYVCRSTICRLCLPIYDMPIMFADLRYADYVCRSTICRLCLPIYDKMSLAGMPIMFADLLYNVSGGNADYVCLSTI